MKIQGEHDVCSAVDWAGRGIDFELDQVLRQQRRGEERRQERGGDEWEVSGLGSAVWWSAA